MRVLFITVPVATHYMPVVPLAWAFRAAGHDVRIAAGNSAIVKTISASGLTSVRVGGEFDTLSATARGLQLESLPPDEARRQNEARLDEYAKATELMARDLLDFAEWWRPDLVVGDPLASMAPLISERLGVPLVRHLISVDAMRHFKLPGSGAPVEGDVRATWPVRLVDLFDRFGVEVKADYAVRTVDPCPPSAQVPGVPNQVSMRYVAYNGPGVAPEWLIRPVKRPRVAVTWGTVTTSLRGPESFYVPQICKILTKLGAEVVVAASTSDRELLGEPGPGIRVVESLPLHLLFPTCDAFVHHGGGSCMLTAALSALPQVIWGHIPDQILNAERMAYAGTAIALTPRAAGLDELEPALERLLGDEELRAGAERMRNEIEAQPSPTEVARTLQELV
jgi:UDP:flavonoid glycosyltransferase YjiC (YdhE family)